MDSSDQPESSSSRRGPKIGNEAWMAKTDKKRQKAARMQQVQQMRRHGLVRDLVPPQPAQMSYPELLAAYEALQQQFRQQQEEIGQLQAKNEEMRIEIMKYRNARQKRLSRKRTWQKVENPSDLSQRTIKRHALAINEKYTAKYRAELAKRLITRGFQKLTTQEALETYGRTPRETRRKIHRMLSTRDVNVFPTEYAIKKELKH